MIGYIPYSLKIGCSEQLERRMWLGLETLLPINSITKSLNCVCWYEVDIRGRLVGLITVG